jgi:hypothetical protein
LKDGVEAWAGPVGFSVDGNELFAMYCFFSRTEKRLQVWDAPPLPADRAGK